MHFKIFGPSLLACLLLFACHKGPSWDRLEYYNGNPSLPPPYQQSVRMKLDSQGLQIVRKSANQQEELLAQGPNKLGPKAPRPQTKELPPPMPGAPVSSMAFYQGDSLVFSAHWQAHQLNNKALKRWEKRLWRWAKKEYPGIDSLWQKP